jgi:hypothetical protein
MDATMGMGRNGRDNRDNDRDGDNNRDGDDDNGAMAGMVAQVRASFFLSIPPISLFSTLLPLPFSLPFSNVLE